MSASEITPEAWDGNAVADPFAGLPGHPMMWLLILSELAVFGIGFVGFAIARLLDPAGFAIGQAHLNPVLGGLNTVVLVSSGFLVATGVQVAREGRKRLARGLFVAATVAGMLFLAIKGGEYADLFDAGLTLDSGGFYTLYFLLTGFHALHVVMGIALLLIVAWRDSLENLQTGGAFWHMLDLVWVVLYPLLYLIR